MLEPATSMKEVGILEHIKDIEKIQNRKTRKQFEYELNVKSTKQKLIKGAKRNPFEIVENLNSSNLVFSVGAWHQFVICVTINATLISS